MESHPACPPPVGAVSAAPPVSAATGAPVPRPRRRRRRWLIGLACLFGLLAVAVGGYCYLGWQQGRDLDAAIAEIERADPRWRWDEMMEDRPKVPDAENPALVVLKVDAMLRPGNYDLGQKNYQLFEKNAPVNRLNGMQITALRVALTRHAEALKLARTLKDFAGEGRHSIPIAPDWISTNLDPLQRTRGIAWMLQHDAMLRAEEGDGAGAMESCRAGLVAGRSIGEEPYLIAALIRYALDGMTYANIERTLAQTEPPEAQLAAMQQLLARELEAPFFVQAMRGERAGSDKLIDTVKDGNIKLSRLIGGPMGPSRSSIEEWLLDYFPIAVSAGRPEYLRLMNKNVEATKLPPEKQAAAFADIEKEAKNSNAVLVRLLLPACTKVSGAHRRTQAHLRCAMVGIALERYRIKHGRWPAALTDLCADGLLSAVPTDPCDGRQLRYKALPDGVLVYSAGLDGEDNGGVIDRDNPVAQGMDIGFQLWNVPARRQAPMPPGVLRDD